MAMPSLDQARQSMREAAEQQDFWDSHYDALLSEHRDQFVAVQGGRIVAADADLAQLIRVLSARHIHIRDTWVRFVTEDHSKLIL